MGGVRVWSGTFNFAKAVFVNDQDLEALDQLHTEGFQIEVRQVPSYQPVPYESLRKKADR